MVGSLAVNAIYLFKVQAATSVGAGDFTPIVEVHTTEGVGTTPAIGGSNVDDAFLSQYAVHAAMFVVVVDIFYLLHMISYRKVVIE